MIEKLELTNNDLMGIYKALIEIKKSTPKPTMILLHMLNSNLRSLTPIISTYEELRIELAKEYGKKYTEDGDARLDAIKIAQATLVGEEITNDNVTKALPSKPYKAGDYVFTEQGSYVFEGEDLQGFAKEFEELLLQKSSVDVYKISIKDVAGYEVDEQTNPTIGAFLQFCIKD